jgi:hypothetical protein
VSTWARAPTPVMFPTKPSQIRAEQMKGRFLFYKFSKKYENKCPFFICFRLEEEKKQQQYNVRRFSFV